MGGNRNYRDLARRWDHSTKIPGRPRESYSVRKPRIPFRPSCRDGAVSRTRAFAVRDAGDSPGEACIVFRTCLKSPSSLELFFFFLDFLELEAFLGSVFQHTILRCSLRWSIVMQTSIVKLACECIIEVQVRRVFSEIALPGLLQTPLDHSNGLLVGPEPSLALPG